MLALIGAGRKTWVHRGRGCSPLFINAVLKRTHYDNNSDKRLSIISLSSIEMRIHLMWYHKDVNKSQFVVKKMKKLITPFGEIKILIDGQEVAYSGQEGRKLEGLCPNVLGRYQIAVPFIPDGKEHTIACIFEPNGPYERTPESGERLECQSFYNGCGFKMSIGLECEAGYIGGTRASDEYDYDADYLESGMSFLLDANTRTKNYVFGIAWIDNVRWDESIDDNDNRDVETWFGADPTLAL